MEEAKKVLGLLFLIFFESLSKSERKKNKGQNERGKRKERKGEEEDQTNKNGSRDGSVR